MAHIDLQKEHAKENNIAQAAVCDLSAFRLAAAKAAIGGNCNAFADFEKLLEQKDIDAVTISTVDQWHANAAMAALQAGKHVYLEKPMTRYLGEAFALYDTVKKNRKLVFQIGSQGLFGRQVEQGGGLRQGGQGREAGAGAGFLHAQQQQRRMEQAPT